MSRETERIECMHEILNDLGVSLTEEQVKKITEDFSLHIEMEREMSSYQHVGYKEECQNCKSLEVKLSQANKEVEIYHKSVVKRRKTDDVWIEGDSVMYRK